MKTPAVLGILLAIAILASIVYTTMGNQVYRCEVCMNYNGRSSCRTASARTKETAQRTATDNACALISSGSFDAQHCSDSGPVSIKWLNTR